MPGESGGKLINSAPLFVPPDDQRPGSRTGNPGLDLALSIDAHLGSIVKQLGDTHRQQQMLWRAIRVIPGIPVPQITTTSGKANYPELLSPRKGYWWFVIQANALTFSAGSVNLYRGGTGAEDSLLVGAFPSAGYLTYGGAGLPVPPGEHLIFAAQAVTGNVTPSLASVIEVADWAVPSYLM